MPTLRFAGGALAVAFVLYLTLSLAATPGTGGVASRPLLTAATDGNALRGAQLLQDYGCTSCHVIPGMAIADSRVGPSLEDLALRRYVGGDVPNTPDRLAAFIMDPQTYTPGSAMPNVGVSELDARDMVAYLQTLE